MITFLALPRAFVGEFDGLQRAAMRSWRRDVPDCQIILFGDEAGVEQVRYQVGAMHLPDVHYHAGGAPLCDVVFRKGDYYALHDWLCFVSADVQLRGLPDAVSALAGIERPLVIGQRHDLEDGAAWATATLHAACGVDYFLYRRGTLGAVLPFAVRGGGGDNWLVWKALTAWDMRVIDATPTITALHINHDHPEWPTGKAGRQGSAEQRYNRLLYEADGMKRPYGVDDAPYVLAGGQVVARERMAA